MFLCGSVAHQLDDKNRIRLSSKMRDDLGDKYLLLPGTDGCIYLFKNDGTMPILSDFGSLDSLDPAVQKRLRLLISNGFAADADKQGRFMLPPHLLKFAKIKKNVRIVGNISKIEIWAEEEWNKRMNENDLTAENVDELYRLLNEEQKQK